MDTGNEAARTFTEVCFTDFDFIIKRWPNLERWFLRDCRCIRHLQRSSHIRIAAYAYASVSPIGAPHHQAWYIHIKGSTFTERGIFLDLLVERFLNSTYDLPDGARAELLTLSLILKDAYR